MSNYLAVATVTSALRAVVEHAAAQAVGGAHAVVGRPPAPVVGEDPRVQVYLYQISPNAAFRCADLPTRNAEGRLTHRPQAAVDLHYLLSFYGKDTEMQPDRMLGAVVAQLHAHPTLDRKLIKDSSTGVLANSNLADAVEHVKLTPAQISLDELTKLWSMMVQVPHVLSIGYVGTVVLLEPEETPEAPLPVLRRGEDDRGVDTRVGPFPGLSGLWMGAAQAATRSPLPVSFPSAQLGSALIVAGVDLGGDALRLRFQHMPLRDADGKIVNVPPVDIDVAAADRTGTEIRVQLPGDAPAQSAWPAGIYTVSAVVTRGNVDQPATGALPLALAPRITALQPATIVTNGGDAALTVTCRPRVRKEQSIVLVVANREVAPADFGASSDTLQFTIEKPPLVNGALVRLRVDGVDSLPFLFDAATGGFAFDDQQRITIQ